MGLTNACQHGEIKLLVHFPDVVLGGHGSMVMLVNNGPAHPLQIVRHGSVERPDSGDKRVDQHGIQATLFNHHRQSVHAVPSRLTLPRQVGFPQDAAQTARFGPVLLSAAKDIAHTV